MILYNYTPAVGLGITYFLAARWSNHTSDIAWSEIFICWCTVRYLLSFDTCIVKCFLIELKRKKMSISLALAIYLRKNNKFTARAILCSEIILRINSLNSPIVWVPMTNKHLFLSVIQNIFFALRDKHTKTGISLKQITICQVHFIFRAFIQ